MEIVRSKGTFVDSLREIVYVLYMDKQTMCSDIQRFSIVSLTMCVGVLIKDDDKRFQCSVRIMYHWTVDLLCCSG